MLNNHDMAKLEQVAEYFEVLEASIVKHIRENNPQSFSELSKHIIGLLNVCAYDISKIAGNEYGLEENL